MNRTIRIAILDLYEGEANEGMRCIKQILTEFKEKNNLLIEWDVFDLRLKNEVPDISYDIFISSGGPGSPLESIGSDWEKNYFDWLSQAEGWNNNPANLKKKYVFFICHSFQLICRHYDIAKVCKRKSTSFGVFPIHLAAEAKADPVFEGMNYPVYIVDSRDFQVIEPDRAALDKLGATVLAIEKDRPHVALERAVMAVRFNEYMIGAQFHPEADAEGMRMYLLTDEKKHAVIENFGEAKWQSMIDQLNDPDKIMFTYSHVLPNFLKTAIAHL